MKTNFQNKAEKFWDKTANSFDKEEKKDGKIFLQIIEKSKNYLKPTDFVLDFGCGTGLTSNELSKKVKNIYAIDISAKMIEIANEKAQKQKINNIEFLHTTIFNNHLKPESYDVILSFYILHLLEDTQEVLTKIYALLKPGGILISVTPCMGENTFSKLLFSIVCKMGIVPEIHFYKSTDLENLISNGQFKIIEKQLLIGTSNQYFMVAKK